MQYRKRDFESSCEIFIEDRLMSPDREEFNSIVGNFVNSEKQNLIINLTNTKYLDTAGLGTLLLALQKINDANKFLILRNPQTHIKESLSMLNFNSIFKIEFNIPFHEGRS